MQRIESDEEAVKIMTIHKSKGLEFDIVIAPYLDLKISEIGAFTSYRDDKTGDYCFVGQKHLLDKKSVWNAQQEQENRRLLYVAITRAKYNCFLFKDSKTGTTLSKFYEELKNTDSDYISIDKYINSNVEYKGDEYKSVDYKYPRIPEIELGDRHWRKMSYSYLAGTHQYIPKEIKKDAYPDDSYSQFIFKDLPRGAHVGNMLHNIFEFVNFMENKDGQWENIIDISLQQFLPKYKGEFNTELLEMTKHIVEANIKIGDLSFSLSEIDYEHRKSEIEFDINVSRFKVDELMELQSLMPEGFEINAKTNEDIEGILNGFVDLFFEYKGKYYVLDWKSNFLGDTMEDYTEGKLIDAMNESNYHLQYLIYTMAMKKYLSMKIPNFDYEKQFGGAIYVFLRGVRAGNDNGIFSHKPSLELIEKLEAIFKTKEQQ